MNVGNALAYAALFALAPLSFASAGSGPVEAPPVYLCDGCTAQAYVDGARSLGPGRHVLFDFPSGVPRAFNVGASNAMESAVVTSVPVTEAEKRRFDLSRHIWSDPSPTRVSEAELEDWMRTRDVPRTAAAVLVTSAYRNEFAEALETLLPYILPGTVPGAFSRVCKRCRIDEVKEPPQGREIVVTLAAGGAIDFEVDEREFLRARAVHDETGAIRRLDDAGGVVGD